MSTAHLLLQRWHLLSLDAPTVAVVWTLAFAHAARIRLPLLAPFLLALATWLLYVADRLLDGLRLTPGNALQERHHFHRRHQTAFLAVAFPLLALLSWLVVRYMDPAPRFEDLLLATAAGFYLLLVHSPGTSHRLGLRWLSRFSTKEAAVGVIFAAACIIPAWSRGTLAHRSLFFSGLLFGALCWLNCVLIDHWEAPHSDSTPGSVVHIAGRCLALATVAVMLVTSAMHQWRFALLALCILLSTASLLLLDRRAARLAPLQLRALADAVLLTPIFILLPSILRP